MHPEVGHPLRDDLDNGVQSQGKQEGGEVVTLVEPSLAEDDNITKQQPGLEMIPEISVGQVVE